eukprot:1395031-Amorphochlora_amoeboformis.AAC.2
MFVCRTGDSKSAVMWKKTITGSEKRDRDGPRELRGKKLSRDERGVVRRMVENKYWYNRIGKTEHYASKECIKHERLSKLEGKKKLLKLKNLSVGKFQGAKKSHSIENSTVAKTTDEDSEALHHRSTIYEEKPNVNPCSPNTASTPDESSLR